MAKFKVGDRVNYAGGQAAACYNRHGGRVIIAVFGGNYEFEDGGAIAIKTGDRIGGDYELEIVTPAASPIRTITKRKIMTGTYAGVSISSRGNLLDVMFHGDKTPAELRAAASLFNEIADVLDENAKDAA